MPLKFKMKEGDTSLCRDDNGGPVDLKIVGIGVDYTWSKGTIFIDRKRYVELFEDDSSTFTTSIFKPDADKEQPRQAVENAVASSRLVVEDKAFVREFLAG